MKINAGTWDAENRPIKSESLATLPSAARAREEWSYLPDGRWSQRIVSPWNGSAFVPQFTNRFVWDGVVLLAVLNGNNGVEQSYLRGLDASGTRSGAGGVGGLLAVNAGANGVHFVANDGNGNVSALVDAASGTESARYEYSPFGETLRSTGPMASVNFLRFSTQFSDDVTRRVKYLYREYVPELGRWNSRDPIGEWGGLNLYAFVQNDPVSLFDYLGLAKKKCGVESFVVKWVGRGDIPNPELARNPGALFKLWVKITFKNGGEFDQRCCEYKQNAGYKIKLTRGGQTLEKSEPMKNDDVSRADDVDGNLDDSNFVSNDFPGLPNVQEGDVIEFSFTAEQIVYSPGKKFAANKDKKVVACECEKNDEVARRGPHTASVTGTYSKKLKYDGVPKELK